jgi:hypothetical protein
MRTVLKFVSQRDLIKWLHLVDREIFIRGLRLRYRARYKDQAKDGSTNKIAD